MAIVNELVVTGPIALLKDDADHEIAGDSLHLPSHALGRCSDRGLRAEDLAVGEGGGGDCEQRGQHAEDECED